MSDSLGTFKATLSDQTPPIGINICLQSLWFDGKGDWHKAHDLINDLTLKDAARVHAYLHRKEGDIGNADYWYRRAGEVPPSTSLTEEWEVLVKRYSES